MLCIRPAYLTLTLTLTLPGRMQTSVHCCMAIVLNRSFCFSTVKHLMRSLKILCSSAASFSKSCQIAVQFAFFLSKISSSAVAKRPRDASCLSVVSFNSTKRGVESLLVSYVGYGFITAYGRTWYDILLTYLITIQLIPADGLKWLRIFAALCYA